MAADTNPFVRTKATDFSDAEIEQLWVEWPDKGAGFRSLVKPTDPMPLVVIGSKGCGKTHLMRHLSFHLQEVRAGTSSVTSHLKEEGYLGLFVRCSGLNASRFSGKGQSQEVWDALFEYFLELWLAEVLCEAAASIVERDDLEKEEVGFVAKAQELLDLPIDDLTCKSYLRAVRRCRREVDDAVGNAAMSGRLDVEIRASAGRLVFGLPQALRDTFEFGLGFQTVYLLDELENLDVRQQMHVQTLLRERQEGVSFRLGARLYGIRTLATKAAGEENREESEFSRVELDSRLRRGRRNFARFVEELVRSRLAYAGLGERKDVRAMFQSLDGDPLASQFSLELVGDGPSAERRHMKKLRESLEAAAASGTLRLHEGEITAVIERLSVQEAPLLEKVNLMSLYQAWSRRRDLVAAAEELNRAAEGYLKGERDTWYAGRLRHYKNDLIAQLARENRRRVPYYGFETFVQMAYGNPRSLLTLLKFAHRWAVFLGESPYGKEPISFRAQAEAVLEASEWFEREITLSGDEATRARTAVERLAELFREIRFADKPTECSVCTFSVNHRELSERAANTIAICRHWSFLIAKPRGQRDRNSERVDHKLRLNPMLAPRWDLPIASRGAVALTPSEAEMIFGSQEEAVFKEIIRVRARRMNAPFVTSGQAENLSLPL